MREIWQTKTLEELCNFGNGLWTGKNPPFVKVAVIRNTNFTKDCKLDDSDIAYLDVEQSQFAKRKLQYGDIILEKSGGGPKQAVGRVIIFDKRKGDFSFSNFTSSIRVKDQNEIDFTYLHRFLFFEYMSGVTEKMQSHSTGIRNLKFDEYKHIQISYPPLSEQRRIIEILDGAIASINKAKSNIEKNLQNTRHLFENYLQKVFAKKGQHWEETKLGDVCSLITDGKHGDCENEKDSGFYFLSAKDVRSGTLIFENARQIRKSGFEETHKRTNLKPGDICMVNTGATIGRISIAPDDPRTYKTTFQKSVAVIKTIPFLIDNFYCCYLLKSDLRKLIKASGGTAVPNLLLGDLKRHLISLPKSLKEQQSIVKKLDQIYTESKKLEFFYQERWNHLDELKKTIFRKALSGELTAATKTLIA